MARNIALLAGSLTAAAVLALGLAAAGFGPVSDPLAEPTTVALEDIDTQAVGSEPASVLEPLTADEVLTALDEVGVVADGRVVMVHADGSVQEIEIPGGSPNSSMDKLMRRLERRLARNDGT